VKLFVVRHAKAGDRGMYQGPDHKRPLTKSGFQQARALVDLLAGEEVDRVVSSRYVRCVQTVEPIAEARGLAVCAHDALAEGAALSDVLALIDELSSSAGAVLSSHGDVIGDLIAHLERSGVPDADPSKMKKGSTWMLEVEGGVVAQAAYLPPPG